MISSPFPLLLKTLSNLLHILTISKRHSKNKGRQIRASTPKDLRCSILDREQNNPPIFSGNSRRKKSILLSPPLLNPFLRPSSHDVCKTRLSIIPLICCNAQSTKPWIWGIRLNPLSVKQYSTRGGTSA